MASLGNLTYNITINDESLSSIKEEIASLRATLLVQEAKLECQAEKFGKELGEHVAAKYKKMLAEQEAVDHAIKENWSLKVKRNSRGELVCCGMVVEPDHLEVNGKTLDEYTEEWKVLISENHLGQSVCCGISKGSPFTVHGGQVYVNKTTVCDTPKESSVVTLDEDGVLKAFDENGTLRVRIQLPFKERQ